VPYLSPLYKEKENALHNKLRGSARGGRKYGTPSLDEKEMKMSGNSDGQPSRRGKARDRVNISPWATKATGMVEGDGFWGTGMAFSVILERRAGRV